MSDIKIFAFSSIIGITVYLFILYIKTPKLAHDPNDLRPSDTASVWEYATYCPKCAHEPSISDELNGICPFCGSRLPHEFGHGVPSRSTRKIWNGSKWVWQMRYHLDFARTKEITVISDHLFGEEALPPPPKNTEEKTYFR